MIKQIKDFFKNEFIDAKSARDMSEYMKNFVEKKKNKERKRKVQIIKKFINHEIINKILLGEKRVNVYGIDSDIVADITEYLTSCGYLNYFDPIRKCICISWEESTV